MHTFTYTYIYIYSGVNIQSHRQGERGCIHLHIHIYTYTYTPEYIYNLIGKVSVGDGASVWYAALLRGDAAPVVLGEGSVVSERAVLVGAVVGDTS